MSAQPAECSGAAVDKTNDASTSTRLAGEEGAFSSQSERADSARLKARILRHQTALMDINIQALKPYLMREDLITSSEIEEMDSKASEGEKITFLLNVVLERKGPVAHTLFTKCLGEEKSHPMHSMLHHRLTRKDPSDTQSNALTRKRPAVHMNASWSQGLGLFVKRCLNPFEMKRPLKGKTYSRIMGDFQTYHHTGNWDALESEAQPFIDGTRGSIQLQATALLEMAIGYTFKGRYDSVDRFVEKARSLLHKITGNNRRFLEGRCEHVLSCRYRYSKQFEKAREHTHRAKVALFGGDAGEDSSWAHYCDACVLMEEHMASSNMTQEKLKRLKESFQLAIDHARQHNTGMDVVEPHSHIRMAQLCMGSTQFTAGMACSKEMLKEAEQHLDAVDLSTLKQRSKSLYHLFRSDLSLNHGDKAGAMEHARKALKLGQPNYITEIESAQERIRELTDGPTTDIAMI